MCVGEVDDNLAIEALTEGPHEEVGEEHEEADDEATRHKDVAEDDVEHHPRLHLSP